MIDASHGERFIDALDTYLPDWRQRRAHLNAQSLTDAQDYS
ncbi:hypothetical protein [Thauera humireducens]